MSCHPSTPPSAPLATPPPLLSQGSGNIKTPTLILTSLKGKSVTITGRVTVPLSAAGSPKISVTKNGQPGFLMVRLTTRVVSKYQTRQKITLMMIERLTKKTLREKLIKCNKCDYASSQAGHLRTHFITHNGVKLIKCNLCDHAFSQAGYLKRHFKHSWRMQTVLVCNSQPSNLWHHLKTHTGEKSNKCNH